MSSSFHLQIFSTVTNHDFTLWFDFLVHFTRRQASLAISNYEYAKKRYRLYVYIQSQLHVRVNQQDHLCVVLRVFIHCVRNGNKLQIVRPQGAARGVGLVGILISGNAYRVRKITKIIVSLSCALMIAWKKFGKVWHKFWCSHLPYRSISQEGSQFPKGDAALQTPNHQLLHRSTLKKIMVNNHGYTLGLIFQPILGLVLYV